MNKHNLIKLGALAQKTFHMKNNFEIVEVPPGWHCSMIATMNNPVFHLDIDKIALTKFGSKDFKSIWAGYSKKANKLIVAEAE